MAEDLGEILIRFGEGGGGGGIASREGATGAASSRATDQAAKSALSSIMGSLPDMARVVQTGMRGGSLGGVISSGQAAAAAAGGGAAVTALAGVAITVGSIAVAAYGIHRTVQSVLNRVSELARVNPAMAMVDAMRTLSEMKRDMQEAQVLGPLYSQVVGLWDGIKTMFQPFLLAVKAGLLQIMVPILQLVGKLLKWLIDVCIEIGKTSMNILYAMAGFFREAGFAFNAFAQAFPDLASIFQPIANGYFTLQQYTRAMANGIGHILTIMQQQTQNKGAGGQWALDTLNTLAHGMFHQVPIAPGAPYAVPVRTAPPRRNRPGGMTP